MKLEELNKEYDKLQWIYGDEDLDSIYNGGCKNNPDICFVFMNPTKKILAASKDWHGLKSPWIGIKNIWDLFYEVGLLDSNVYEKIKKLKRTEWTEEFADYLYEYIAKNKYFITNLAKCTLNNARAIANCVYEKYLDLFYKEIEIINPKVVILFGNQVSSIVLKEKVEVSKVRKKEFTKSINNKEYKFYSVFYPIGNGRYNIDKSIEDIKWIINNLKKKETTYKLVSSQKEDIPRLIDYKQKNIYIYASNLPKEEQKRIDNYIKQHIPLDLINYQNILVEDKIIGCLLIKEHEDGVILDEIYLEEKYRNQNIGTRIISNLTKQYPKIYLFVYKGNQRAISLYKRLGFKVIEETENRFYMCYQKNGKN